MTKELLYELSKNSLGKHIMVAQLAAKLYQKHRNKPLTFTVSVLGSFTCLQTNKPYSYMHLPEDEAKVPHSSKGNVTTEIGTQ